MTVLRPQSAKVIASGSPTCPPPPITHTSFGNGRTSLNGNPPGTCTKRLHHAGFVGVLNRSDGKAARRRVCLARANEANAEAAKHQAPEDPERRAVDVM